MRARAEAPHSPHTSDRIRNVSLGRARFCLRIVNSDGYQGAASIKETQRKTTGLRASRNGLPVMRGLGPRIPMIGMLPA